VITSGQPLGLEDRLQPELSVKNVQIALGATGEPNWAIVPRAVGKC
jgi:hypothetical protein